MRRPQKAHDDNGCGGVGQFLLMAVSMAVAMVVGPLGDVVAEGGSGTEIITAELDPAAVAEARRTNPSLANRRL